MAYQTLTSFSQSLPDATGSFKVRVKAGVNRPSGLIATGSFTATVANPYNTILTFPTASTDSEAGVNGTVPNADADLKFEFNAITSLTGVPNTMLIKVGGVDSIVIDFFSDYVGQPFRFTDAAGVAHNETFINQTVSF